MDLFRPHQTSSTATQGDTPSTSQGHEEPTNPSSTVLFREIHKNAWLRKLSSAEKRVGAAPKKGDRVWAVFCVHDDIHPFLELYMEQKMAAAHKPDWCVSLSSTLHVSPTIVAHDQEYEFVITLPSDVVRLTAPSWEIMMEWVDTIRSKLREMRILCPRENVYSRMPEPRLPLLPTRDPNSPLPPPPLGPSALVPGVEPVHLETADTIGSSSSAAPSQTSSAGPSHSATSATRTVSDATPQRTITATPSSLVAVQGDVRTRHRTRSSSLSESAVAHSSSSPRSPGINGSSSRTPLLAAAISPRSTPNRHPVSPLPSRSSASFRNQVTNGNVGDAPLSPAPIQASSSASTPASRPIRSPVPQTSASSTHARSPGLNSSGNHNVTVIEVADTHHTPNDIFNFNFIRDALPQTDGDVEPLEQFFTPPITPRSRASIAHPPQTDQLAATTSPPSRLWQQITQVVSNLIGQPAQSEVIRVNQGITNITIPSHQDGASESQSRNMNVYEHVYPIAGNDSAVPTSAPTSTPAPTPTPPITTSGPVEEVRARPLQPSVSSGRQEASEHHQRRRRTSSGSEILSPRSRSAANVTRHAAPLVDTERRLHPVPHPFRQETPVGEQSSGLAQRVTLRDQQVQQLRKEKLHPGGVRLQVRRKDCTNSIAFIDAFGHVWIAGWKQREHPMLYNALHIGDQLLSVAGLSVVTAADAHRFIRASNSLYVPFIIRRVPFGHVFAFRRDAEGQSLGISLEGGTAEVKEVAADSPAARGGLPSRAPTCDGLSLTPWVITEINGRPLNLFFKDGEVRDRLNAVGKEISVLVQPFDLIKQIKKQLKTIRGYKQFIVQ
ncbi:uncharacterized protein LOC117639477 [Thrips palmi]|uniref:Uncharacterized protein LOC117639477 n=1 Tax=Thrips palmi TaxID=161013 RepID=A0A6P8YBA7_THRPL|nr:uncharacterized protein LOC117639477 [Thrips palmi]